jgi:ribosomal protein S18 acetylase RimI-like enzyme
VVEESGVTITLVSKKNESHEDARLASATGSEEPEIEEMISKDRIFAASRKGRTIGFIALKTTKEKNTMEISGLATDEHERRKGIAKLLIDQAEKEAQRINVDKMTVRTSNDNIPALSLYQQKGFKIVAVRLGALVEHHGGTEIKGWHGFPVRDEFMLEKAL